jgi:hypothetical protein
MQIENVNSQLKTTTVDIVGGLWWFHGFIILERSKVTYRLLA